MILTLFGIWIVCATAVMSAVRSSPVQRLSPLRAVYAAATASIATIAMTELWSSSAQIALLGLSLLAGAGMTLVQKRGGRSAVLVCVLTLYTATAVAIVVAVGASTPTALLRLDGPVIALALLVPVVSTFALHRIARAYAKRSSPQVSAMALAILVYYCLVSLGFLVGWWALLFLTGEA